MVLVLDCNIWISLAINSQINFITDLNDNGIQIASCQILRNEITDVLSRPKLSKFISKVYIEKVTQLHDIVTTQYIIGSIKNIVADDKDNYLFALSIIES